MAEQAQRRPVWTEDHLAPAAHAAATLRALPPATRFIFRGDAAAAAMAGAVLGPVPPSRACSAAFEGGRAALWLGPDEWLLLAPEADAESVSTALTAALAAVPHALVDVSHRNTALEISGPYAADVLNAGCPLDLHIGAFPVGMCCRTILGKAEIILWRNAESTFHIGMWRSFAPYVWDFLVEARARL
jgi:sarcosine oxidase subunit gamma